MEYTKKKKQKRRPYAICNWKHVSDVERWHTNSKKKRNQRRQRNPNKLQEELEVKNNILCISIQSSANG